MYVALALVVLDVEVEMVQKYIYCKIIKYNQRSCVYIYPCGGGDGSNIYIYIAKLSSIINVVRVLVHIPFGGVDKSKCVSSQITTRSTVRYYGVVSE